jgi:predicted phosphoribosyltransferase
MEPIFQNRRDAGRRLAAGLRAYAHLPNVLVLGLTRGGVPVAFEIAKALRAPLDIVVVRKLGAPGNPELAVGAIGPGNECVWNTALIKELRLSQESLDAIARNENAERLRREKYYRGHAPQLSAADKIVLLVDDGIATGASIRAAARAVRHTKPARLVLASPVAAADLLPILRSEADDVIVLSTPEFFLGVGQWYRDFPQTDDSEVISCLSEAQKWCPFPSFQNPTIPG